MSASAKKQPLPPLFDGRRMTCPECRYQGDLLEFSTDEGNVAYQSQTVPVHRCPRGHHFALKPDPPVLIPPAPRPRRRRR